MKKTIIVTLAVLFGSSFLSTAQRQEGEVDITVGAGYSLGMNALRGLINIALVESDLEKVKSVPIINGMIDYGITENFSLGGAYSFHRWSWNDRFTDTSGVTTSGSATAMRHNIGARALFHFGENDDVDIYAGGRVGTSIWRFDASYSDSEGNSASDFSVPNGIFSVQALFGVRAYFNEFVGANFEFGLGTAPYLIAGGLTFRIR